LERVGRRERGSYGLIRRVERIRLEWRDPDATATDADRTTTIAHAAAADANRTDTNTDPATDVNPGQRPGKASAAAISASDSCQRISQLKGLGADGGADG
jgi:hypothetical protein